MTIEKRYSLKDLKQLTGTSHAYIYKQIQKGNLAKPEKWGRASRWKESDVNAWLPRYGKAPLLNGEKRNRQSR